MMPQGRFGTCHPAVFAGLALEGVHTKLPATHGGMTVAAAAAAAAMMKFINAKPQKMNSKLPLELEFAPI